MEKEELIKKGGRGIDKRMEEEELIKKGGRGIDKKKRKRN